MESSKRLLTIVEKLERLQQKQQALLLENKELRDLNKELTDRLLNWQNAQAATEQNISEHAPEESDKEKQQVRAVSDQNIRQQIDHYLSEIDKCIEWLSEQ